MIPGTPVCIYRGTTAQFSTTFYDAQGNVVQPDAAELHIVYVDANDLEQEVTIEMTPPNTGVVWTAQWDSRGASPGLVSWSIHTVEDSIPYGVEDGAFELTANNANLVTF